MKNTKMLGLVSIVLAIFAGSLAHAQLIYTPGPAVVSSFSAMKADAPFVANTLLNLGSVNAVPDGDGAILAFNYAGLSFNAIPNLGSNPSDIQVGAGFFADVIFLGKDSADDNTFGSEATLLGVGNQALFPTYGAGSNNTWHITAAVATDLIFWHQDNSMGGAKFSMSDTLAFTTFTASDIDYTYYIFGIDDRRTSLQDFDDGVFGVRLNNQPVGIEPVPEPSTYGLIGAAALIGIVAYRRTKQKAVAVC